MPWLRKRGARTRYWFAFLAVPVVAIVAAIPAQARTTTNFTEADVMLDLLRSCHDNRATAGMVDHVMALAGTHLVAAQLNISRRVTMQQYRDALQAACEGKIADVKPAEPGSRAENGVRGLIQDVAPSLIWGRDHVPLLESRLAELRRNRLIGQAIPIARKYLPEPAALHPKLYVVMGGRAGAATIDDQLYYDVLITEWRISRGEAAPMTPQEVVDFFAHETHHLATERFWIAKNPPCTWHLRNLKSGIF